MAKQFTVGVKYIAEDKASAVIGKLERSQAQLSKEIVDSAEAFAKGEIDVKEYTEAIDRATKEQAKLDRALSQTRDSVDETGTRFSRFSASLKRNAIAATAAVAALAGAFRLVKQSSEEAGQSGAFERGLAAQGQAADEFLVKLQQVSDNQISNAALILATNRALALGIRAEDLPALLDTAARASIKLGVSATQAFDDITTGVGRASPLILDNLGIIVDAEQAYRDMAESIGVSVEELSAQARTLALTNAVVGSAETATDNFSLAQNDLARAISRSEAVIRNLASATGTLLGGALQGTLAGLLLWLDIFTLIPEAVIKANKAFANLLSSLPLVGDGFREMARTLQQADDDLDKFQQTILSHAKALGEGFLASVDLTTGTELLGEQVKQTNVDLKEFNLTTRKTGDEAETAAEIIDRLSAGLSELEDDSTRSARASDRNAEALRREAAAADIAADSTIRLSAAKQAANAVTLANANSGQRGGRIYLPGGGSRLIRPSRGGKFTSFTISGGQFTTIQPKVL